MEQYNVIMWSLKAKARLYASPPSLENFFYKCCMLQEDQRRELVTLVH